MSGIIFRFRNISPIGSKYIITKSLGDFVSVEEPEIITDGTDEEVASSERIYKRPYRVVRSRTFDMNLLSDVDHSTTSTMQRHIVQANNGMFAAIIQRGVDASVTSGQRGLIFLQSADNGETWTFKHQLVNSNLPTATMRIDSNNTIRVAYSGVDENAGANRSVFYRKFTWNSVTNTWDMGSAVTVYQGTSTTGASFCGFEKEIESGRLWINYRLRDTAADTWGIPLHYSDDDGLTWSSAINVPVFSYTSNKRYGSLITINEQVILVYHDTNAALTEFKQSYIHNVTDDPSIWSTLSIGAVSSGAFGTHFGINTDTGNNIAFVLNEDREETGEDDDTNIKLAYYTKANGWSRFINLSPGGGAYPNLITFHDGENMFGIANTGSNRTLGIKNFNISTSIISAAEFVYPDVEMRNVFLYSIAYDLGVDVSPEAADSTGADVIHPNTGSMISVTGDYVNIRCNEQFDYVKWSLSRNGTDGTINWQYWNGAEYSSLPLTASANSNFTNDGYIRFTRPSDWEAIDGFYWVRALVASDYTITPKGTQVYCRKYRRRPAVPAYLDTSLSNNRLPVIMREGEEGSATYSMSCIQIELTNDRFQGGIKRKYRYIEDIKAFVDVKEKLDMKMKEDEFKVWKAKLNASHRKFKKIEREIKEWREYYRGNQWGASAEGYNDQVVVNMFASNIKTILPSINFDNPRVYVEATKKPYKKVVDGQEKLFDTISAAKYSEILLNYYLRELKIKRQIDLGIMDALIGHWGLVKIGYSVKTEKVQGDNLLEVNEIIKEDSPFVMRISPLDFRVDPEAKDSQLADARWVAFRWVKEIDEVKEHPFYENTKNIKENYTCSTDSDDGGVKSSYMEDDAGVDVWKRVEGWDIWDKKSRTIITIVEGHDKPIQYRKWPIEYEGFPCETIYFNEDPDELYPIADIEFYQKEQDELNRLRSSQLDHVRRVSNRKYLARKNMLDTNDKRNLTHGPSGTVIEVSDPTSDVLPLHDASISMDINFMANQVKQDIRERAGVSAFESGTAQKLDTAAEAMAITAGVSAKREESVKVVEDFWGRVVRKLFQVIQKSMDKKEVPIPQNNFMDMFKNMNGSAASMGASEEELMSLMPSAIEKITGPDGKNFILPWLNLSKEDIEGEYDFIIEVGSTQPVNEAVRKRDALELAQVLNGNPYIRGREATRKLLEVYRKTITDPDAMLKTDEELEQETTSRVMTQMQSEMAVDKQKRDADLTKTSMKNETKLKDTLIKEGRM